MNLFQFRTVSEFTNSLARYLPGGRLFESKNNTNSNMYMFLEGMANEAFRANNLLRDYNREYYPDQTTDLLEEWEKAVSIPDQCFTIEGVSITDRRRNVLVKLAGMSIQTAAEFEALSAQFGVAATVVGGKDASVSPVITPDKTARFTIVIQFVPGTAFPYTFPFVFGNDIIGLLECIFLRSKPANCVIRFDPI